MACGPGQCGENKYEARNLTTTVSKKGDCSTLTDALLNTWKENAINWVKVDVALQSKTVECGPDCEPCKNVQQGTWTLGDQGLKRDKGPFYGPKDCAVTITVTYDRWYRFDRGDCLEKPLPQVGMTFLPGKEFAQLASRIDGLETIVAQQFLNVESEHAGKQKPRG